MDDLSTSVRQPSALHAILVGDLLGDLVHRLNNPLTLLDANLDYLTKALRGGEHGTGSTDETGDVIGECQEAVSELVRLTRDLRAWGQASEEPVMVNAHEMWGVPMRLAAIAGRYHAELSLLPADEDVRFTARPAALYRGLLGMLWLGLSRPVAHGPLLLCLEVSPAEVRYVLRDRRGSTPPGTGLVREWTVAPDHVVQQATVALAGRWERSSAVHDPVDVLVLPRG